jgi:hypothetical protein
MLFLAADHTIERVGPVQTLGFGNLGSATALDLSTFTNLAVTTGGPTGAVDMAIIGATIDLNTLTQSQQSYLTGILPVALATSPTNPNFSIQGTGFGHDGVATTVYGTQNSFSNTITGFIQPFSGSYTTNANNQPLNYTEQIETWTYDSISGLGGASKVARDLPCFRTGQFKVSRLVVRSLQEGPIWDSA